MCPTCSKVVLPVGLCESKTISKNVAWIFLLTVTTGQKEKRVILPFQEAIIFPFYACHVTRDFSSGVRLRQKLDRQGKQYKAQRAFSCLFCS